MNTRFLIGVFIFILALFLVLFWRPSAKESILQNIEQAPASAPTLLTNNYSNIGKGGIDTPSTTSVQTATEIAAASNKAIKLRALELQQIAEGGNAPVHFFGKVTDQNDKPIANAKVTMHLRHNQYSPSVGPFSNYPQIETTTDLSGHFEWADQGATGDTLSVDSILKDGYELEPNTLRSYNTASGSLESPIIFKMWSANLHEQLITGEKKFQIVPDGRPYIIDLIKGTIADSGEGDLKVWIKRPDQVTNGKKYDWSCEIDAINGGLMENADPHTSMFSAPANGYEQSFRFEQNIGSGWGDSTGTKRFYVMLHNGQIYGRISIELYAYYNDQIPGLIRLQYAINPSGSRILR